MANPPPKSEVREALMKGAIAEAILLVIGAAIFWATGEIAWIIGAAVAGSAIILLLTVQAGALKRP